MCDVRDDTTTWYDMIDCKGKYLANYAARGCRFSQHFYFILCSIYFTYVNGFRIVFFCTQYCKCYTAMTVIYRTCVCV